MRKLLGTYLIALLVGGVGLAIIIMMTIADQMIKDEDLSDQRLFEISEYNGHLGTGHDCIRFSTPVA